MHDPHKREVGQLTKFQNSLPGRALALRPAIPWYWCPADLRQGRGFLLHQRQLHRPRRHQVEVPRHLLRLDLLRAPHRLLPLPRDLWPHPRGACLPYVTAPSNHSLPEIHRANPWETVFEDSDLNEKTVAAVEKQIHYGDSTDAAAADIPHKATAHEKELV